MKDVFGRALLDYYHKSFESPLLLHNEYGPPEIIPIESYFFDHNNFSSLEIFALQQCHGKILDIGAASGRHVYYLQQHGFDVTALDSSPCCGMLMKEIGVKNIIVDSIFTYREDLFDTIYMLMNGLGIAGTVDGLKRFLSHIKKIMNPSAQLIVDSSDISYLYEDGQLPEHKYFGQLTFQYEYKEILDDPFNWLYIDQEKLMKIAEDTGWNCQIIFEDETSAFLARLIAG